MAEGILESKAKKLGLLWEVDSAGTHNNYHIGEAPHPLSQKVARLHSVDISQQCARAFVPEDFDRFDKIYAMSGDILEGMKKIARKKFRPGLRPFPFFDHATWKPFPTANMCWTATA